MTGHIFNAAQFDHWERDIPYPLRTDKTPSERRFDVGAFKATLLFLAICIGLAIGQQEADRDLAKGTAPPPSVNAKRL